MSTRHYMAAFFALVLAVPDPDHRPPPELRILVTNDDGIRSPELGALCRELATIAEVTVCAPDSNRSGSSRAVTMDQIMEVSESELEGAARAVAVSGTPADAPDSGAPGAM